MQPHLKGVVFDGSVDSAVSLSSLTMIINYLIGAMIYSCIWHVRGDVWGCLNHGVFLGGSRS